MGIVKQIEKHGNTYNIIDLNIPYDEKEEAKAVGYIFWNPELKTWYCNASNIEKFKKWDTYNVIKDIGG